MKLSILTYLALILSLHTASGQNFAFNLTSKTDHIKIGDSTEPGAPWTAEMWVYRKGNVPSSPGASVLLNGQSGKINLETWNYGYKVGITYKGKYDRAFNYITPLQKWTHLAFVCNGNYTYLYVNGLKKDSIYHSMEIPAFNLPMSDIGMNNESPNAYIDEIRVWNNARSEKEIFENMNSSVDNTLGNLYGYWFADNQASPATDISTIGRSCIITGATYIANTNTGFVTNTPEISYLSTTVSHHTSSFATPGSNTQEALLINIKTAGVTGTLSVSQINCSPNGTTRLTDIKNARLYSTGSSKTFSTTKQFGSVQAISSVLTFNGNVSLRPGNNYFWLTYDISQTATKGNVMDGECHSVVVGGASHSVAQPSATGSRIINSVLPASPNAITIIPKPNTFQYQPGKFSLSQSTRIIANAELMNEANQMAVFMRRSTGYELPVVLVSPKAGDIILQLNTAEEIPNEGYKLNIDSENISISASSRAGIFYGWQTLRQMFPKAIESKKTSTTTQWTIPSATITDAPRFSYRGFMFDPARYFHSVTFTKKLIDHLAMQKINYLHWHIVDDQGFRFECSKYPELNTIGSWGTQCKRGGYYTKQEMRDIVKYAQDRHIEIIPELEIPGHTQEMLASMPVLRCSSAPANIEVACSYGIISPNIICGGQDTTYRIMENILLEIMDIFPSKYIHIGGDEAPKGNWDACTKCTAFKKSKGIANSHDLQAYMTSHFNNFLKKYGKRIIGWEEILGGLTSSEPIAQQWNNANACYAALKKGRDVIFSDASRFYLDMQQVAGDASRGYGYGWMGVNDLKDVYSYDPVLPTLSQMEKSHIMGMEACMWGETLVDTIHTEYMMYPRLFAAGEAMWSSKEKDFSNFYTRMANRMAVLDSLNTHYRNITLDPAPTVDPVIDTIYTDKPVTLAAKDYSEHYYWSDSTHSKTAEITVSESGVYSVFYTIGKRMIENKYIVIMQSPNSISNIVGDAKDIVIYPNPAKDRLIIKSATQHIKTVRITNTNGQTVSTSSFSNSQNPHIDISQLNAGLYTIEISTTANKLTALKFVKKN